MQIIMMMMTTVVMLKRNVIVISFTVYTVDKTFTLICLQLLYHQGYLICIL